MLVYAAPQRTEAPLPTSVNDLQNAKLLEIKDAAGQVLLTGTFMISQEDDDEDDDGDEIGRSALLTSGASANSRAKGTAEIEIEKKNNHTNQELELKAEGLAAMATLKLWLDGKEIITFTTNKQGKADLKLNARRPIS
jgi:hypothetical protein